MMRRENVPFSNGLNFAQDKCLSFWWQGVFLMENFLGRVSWWVPQQAGNHDGRAFRHILSRSTADSGWPARNFLNFHYHFLKNLITYATANENISCNEDASSEYYRRSCGRLTSEDSSLKLRMTLNYKLKSWSRWAILREDSPLKISQHSNKYNPKIRLSLFYSAFGHLAGGLTSGDFVQRISPKRKEMSVQ